MFSISDIFYLLASLSTINSAHLLYFQCLGRVQQYHPCLRYMQNYCPISPQGSSLCSWCRCTPPSSSWSWSCRPPRRYSPGLALHTSCSRWSSQRSCRMDRTGPAGGSAYCCMAHTHPKAWNSGSTLWRNDKM